MKKPNLVISGLVLSSLLSGCVGTGPNTQQGAVTGGALGALAGAIIGNNSRGGNGLAGALIGGAAGAIAGGTIGNSVDNRNGTVYGYSGRQPMYRSRVYTPPPPPRQVREQIPPAPAADAVWIPGYWNFNGAGYVWASGHWEIPPAHAHNYIAAHWENRDGGYVYYPGGWH